MGGVPRPVRPFPFKTALAFQLALHALPSKWLISRRMAEISHSSSRNFSPRSEFKLVGASEETKSSSASLGESQPRIAQRTKGVHNEVSEIHRTACITDVAARVFAG